MIYPLPANNLYGDEPIPIRLPDNWEVHISEIRGFHAPALTEEELAKTLSSPIGAPPIRQGAKGRRSAVILIDDITRPTPCEPIVRAVIGQLKEAGIRDENIWIVAALGTHAPMYYEHFVRKLGPELIDRYEVHNHNVFFNHVFLGNTSHCVPVEINADVMAADYKIAIGCCMAHSYFGFGGGAKCILPGVSSMRSIVANHSYTTTSDFNMGNPSSLMRSDAEEAARMMGLDFKIDVLMNGQGRISRLFCGDFQAEAEVCRREAARHYQAEFVPDCDVVISNSYLKPAEASCAFTPEVLASLKEGGDFILAANSPLGSCIHYLYDKWGKSAPGGMMWAGCYAKSPKMKNAIVFAQHTVKGSRDAWYIDENSGAVYRRDWEEVLRLTDDGSAKKVVIYPMAEAQILTNSPQFYTAR